MTSRRRRPVLRPLLTEVEQAAQDALVADGKKILARSRELVPRDTGKLSRAGRVTVDHLLVSVVYNHPLAWLQHERTDYRHEGGRQAKFLENAVDDVHVAADVTSAIRARLTG